MGYASLICGFEVRWITCGCGRVFWGDVGVAVSTARVVVSLLYIPRSPVLEGTWKNFDEGQTWNVRREGGERKGIKRLGNGSEGPQQFRLHSPSLPSSLFPSSQSLVLIVPDILHTFVAVAVSATAAAAMSINLVTNLHLG